VTLRVGVVGVGTMGGDHAERLVRRISNADLVAVSDPDGERAAELAARLGGVRVIGDPLALVADPAVDAVILASPGSVHEEQVLACLELDKPVLCEKPLTMDSESSLRLVEAEAKHGRPLVQVGFMRRFDPEYAAMKRLLDSGSLGRPLLLHNVHRNKEAPSPAFRSEMIVRDSLVHEVDVARWLFADEIATVTVFTPTATSRAPQGVSDPQVSVFAMRNGAVVTNEVFVNSQLGYEVRCEAVAEGGTVTAGLGSGVVTRAAGRWGGAVPDDYRVRFAQAYDLEVQAWVDACRRGAVAGAGAWDGYVATVVSSAGMQSLRSGQPVAVELADVP
jgi:myo-inositol 2-dehydrogenase/D-chiro-inositol 1-dehydrogenase